MIEPGTPITDENREEAEREAREAREAVNKSLTSPEFISSLCDLAFRTNEEAHWAMGIAITALIIAVLALLV